MIFTTDNLTDQARDFGLAFLELAAFAPYPPPSLVAAFNTHARFGGTDGIDVLSVLVTLATTKLVAAVPPGTPPDHAGFMLAPMHVDETGIPRQIDPAEFPDQTAVAVARGLIAAATAERSAGLEAAADAFAEFLTDPDGNPFPIPDVITAALEFCFRIFDIRVALGACTCEKCR